MGEVLQTRYTPATCTVTVPKTNFEGQISVQNERILQTSLTFKYSPCGRCPGGAEKQGGGMLVSVRHPVPFSFPCPRLYPFL